MTERVFLRCADCGNAVIVDRADTDPEGTRFVVTSLCNICDTGDFEEVTYYDPDYRMLFPDWRVDGTGRLVEKS